MSRNFSEKPLFLLGTATFAFLWVLARAYLQAVTVDEAVTYTNFVRPAALGAWYPNANNHVLNSLLMRVFTWLFGVSHVTIRAGALIGAAIYIGAAYRLCRWIAASSMVQWPLFVCLVFNPLVLDFLVAARGYGLAAGFLLSAIVGMALFQIRDLPEGRGRSLAVVCAQCSVFAALSFASNFSFAFVDAAAMVMLYLWACRSAQARSRHIYLQLAAACLLPGLMVAAALTAPVVLHFPKQQLVYGAHSFRETLRSIYAATIYEINPSVSEPLRPGPNQIAFLFRCIGILGAVRLAVILFVRPGVGDRSSRPLRIFAGMVAGVVALTLAASWLAFRWEDVLWPKDRTAISLVVLSTLFIGLLAAIPVPTQWGTVSRRGLTATLFALSGYFLLCLRTGYFKEWKWNADADKAYSVLAHYNHSCNLKAVTVNWRYDASLNFYETLSGQETLEAFPAAFGTPFAPYPEGRPAYVLYAPEDQDFLKTHALTVVYRSDFGTVIAIDPVVCGGAKG